MGFWIFMLVMNLMIPGCMIWFGWRFVHKPPRDVNSIYGYRTIRSMKNRDTWQFAHAYFGRIWYRLGMVLLAVAVLGMLPVLGKDEDTVGLLGGALCMVQCVLMIIPVFPTERALKRKFDEKEK